MTRLTATSAFISSSPPHQWAHDPVALERDLCTGPRRRQDLFGSRSRWLQSAIGSIITRPAIYSESTANILLRVEVANPPRRREGGDTGYRFQADTISGDCGNFRPPLRLVDNQAGIGLTAIARSSVSLCRFF